MTPDLTKLTAVADMLETLPARLGPNDRFHMGVFRAAVIPYPTARRGFVYAYDDDRLRPDCGTAACAAGWAAKLLPALGLRWSDTEDEVVAYTGSDGREWDGMTALEMCFGLTESQADHLFGPDNVNDPLVTADRVRDFIAEHTPGVAS